MNARTQRLHRTLELSRPLSRLEWRVGIAWYGRQLTMGVVLHGRMRSRAGRCFAVVDGGRAP